MYALNAPTLYCEPKASKTCNPRPNGIIDFEQRFEFRINNRFLSQILEPKVWSVALVIGDRKPSLALLATECLRMTFDSKIYISIRLSIIQFLTAIRLVKESEHCLANRSIPVVPRRPLRVREPTHDQSIYQIYSAYDCLWKTHFSVGKHLTSFWRKNLFLAPNS